MPGPELYITGPYLEGAGSFAAQMHELTGPDDAARTVEYWASEGVTSFKAYMNITRDELKAAVDTAHRHGIKVTGHLCSIGFSEAAAIGIDNLEHGLLVDTEFHPGKLPDVCPPQAATRSEIARLDLDSAPVRNMIADLVKHNVANHFHPRGVRSVRRRPAAAGGAIPRCVDGGGAGQLPRRARPRPGRIVPADAQKGIEFEFAFVKAGGSADVGCGSHGQRRALAGFADQRNIELLVEAGFTCSQAIQIANC